MLAMSHFSILHVVNGRLAAAIFPGRKCNFSEGTGCARGGYLQTRDDGQCNAGCIPGAIYLGQVEMRISGVQLVHV
jgi:hypothetical protein